MDIESIWAQYSSLAKSTFEDPTALEALFEELGERIIMTPNSRFVHEPGCEPGGMIYASLQVAKTATKLIEVYGLDPEIKRSVVKVALLHDLGKLGDLRHDWLVPQDSGWYREKLGAHYKFNDADGVQKMSVSHRTLYLLQHFGVKLTMDEWLAIQLAGGFHFEENRWYVHGEPDLATVIQHAKHIFSKRRE
jgi:hypothetical protein